MNRAARVGEAQLRSLRHNLSQRDLDVLTSLRSYRLMNGRHIQRLHFAGHASDDTGERVCRRVLRRLHELDLVRRLERRIGGVRAGSAGHIHAITPLGHRILESETRHRWREPSAGFVAHTLAIAEIATMANQLALTHSREVLAIEPEPDAWRTFHDGAVEITLKPDLAMRVADTENERSWFVEVDLDTESRTVLQRKCQIYTHYWRSGIEQEEHGLYPQVLWVAPDDKRAEHIASVFGRQGIEPRLFAATTADRAPLVLANLHEQEHVTTKGDSQ